MKAPHTHLPIDRFEGGNSWASLWMEEMFWNNIVFDEPVIGFTVVEKDGKFNFIDLDTDEYFSDIWFDKVINWAYKDFKKYTVAVYKDRCYAITSNYAELTFGQVNGKYGLLQVMSSFVFPFF